MIKKDIVNYYKERAKEYEKIYDKPERQEDLARPAVMLQDLFANKNVLEIACGTGYWTQKIALSAKSVLATDINESVIYIARSKKYKCPDVSFKVADLFELTADTYEAMFAGFIWSHIPLDKTGAFVEKADSLVKPGGIAVFADNIFVNGSSTPISHQDENGNTYQKRKLENGDEYSVLKNFPARDFVINLLAPYGEEITYIPLKYYWLAAYRKKQ